MKTHDALSNDALWRNDVFADFINGLIFDGQEAVKPEELENAAPLDVYNSKIVNLREFTDEEIDRFHGLIRYVADVFAHRKDRKYRYTKVPIGSEEGWEVIKLINGMNSDMFHNTLQSNYRADTMEGFLSQEEKLQTFAEGKAEGIAEGIAESICSLMQNHDFSFERAADALSIPESDREMIRKMVDKMLQERAA